jgi:hypothetical protein
MNTPKKKSRKRTKTTNDNLEYSSEEAELLGIDLDIDEEEPEEEIEEEDLEEIEEDEIVEDKVKKKEEVKPKRGKKPADKTKFYVDPKQFDEEIISYYNSGILSNELAEMVSKIAHKLSYAPNFINYSYREEMVGDGVIRMFKALMSKKYNHSKGNNPFSYFTRIAFNAFRNRIKKEKHMHETHEKYKNEYIMFSEHYNNLVKNNNTKRNSRDT